MNTTRSFFKLPFFAVLAFSVPGFAYTPCASELRELVSHYQRGIVDEALDPVKIFGNGNGDRRGFLSGLENDVIELIDHTPPEFRMGGMRALQKKYSLPEGGIESIVDYYAYHIWEDLEIVGDPLKVQARFSDLRRSLKLTEPKAGSAESRYFYYLSNLTSVFPKWQGSWIRRKGWFTRS